MPVAEPGGRVQPNHNNTEKANNVDLDPKDPRVKKLVYSMYRDMLTNYSDEASAFISHQDPAHVTKDCGVLPIIETILRGGGNTSDSGSAPSELQGASVAAPPPPPPPMAPPGAIPAVRLNSEIGPREKGPPAALAGAMMKDKKPFTYTPGGIDLSEIRSPRMAKRLQQNAAAEGVTSAPKPAGTGQGPPPTTPHAPLPPAAVAAMQPQMAFCVFPQGAAPTLNRSHKPHDYTDGSGEISVRPGGGIINGNKSNNGTIGGPPPPPPPPQSRMHQGTSNGPPQPPLMQMQIQREPEASHQPPSSQGPPPPPAQVIMPASVPMKPRTPLPAPTMIGLGQPIQFDEDRRINNNNSINVGQGSIYIQPISPPIHQAPIQPQQPTSSLRGFQQRQAQTKAQATSQNLGSIYIPPVELNQGQGSTYSPSTAPTPSSAGSSISTRSPQHQPFQTPTPPTTMQTPQLKKTPTPWMNSYNKMATKQAESPPYVNPGNISTPWGIIGNDGSQLPANQSGVVYTIPIAVAREEQLRAGAVSPEQNKAKAAQHLGRVIPIQIQRQESLNKEHQIQAEQERGWPTPRTIPIQVESRPSGQTPTGNKRGGVTPSTSSYNNPMGLYSGQNVAEAYKQQTGNLASGVNNMSMEPEKEPIQSKSMRVIQKVAENELRRLSSMDDEVGYGSGGGYGFTDGVAWPQQQYDPWSGMELFRDGQNLFNIFNPQVDEGSYLHNTTEPRFRGGHIPSKAFKTLQTTLPANSDGGSVASAPPQTRTSKVQQAGSGPIMHNIPIQMTSTSPTPPSHRQPPPSSSPIPPSEQRATSPKKYMGSNIPSRSFKMLQAMTAPEDGDAPAAFDASSSSDSDTNMGGGGGEQSLESPSPCPSPCPSVYLSWHYWWYYVSCYWAGYDMTGYDYPEGWDPENPYFPPELASMFDETSGVVNDSLSNQVPQIVVEQDRGDENEFCDSEYFNGDQTNNATHKNVLDDERTEKEIQCDDETEEEDEIKCNKTMNVRKNSEKSEFWSEEEDHCNTPIIEEPSSTFSYSAHNSEDSDAATIVDEAGVLSPSLLLIEEYFSSSESECARSVGGKHILSTIEELTDESRGSTPRHFPHRMEEEQVMKAQEDEVEEEIDDSSSEDEASSVSVIENKSASQSQQSVSKREDETSSSSSSSEQGDDDDNVPAVTVRLPLKLSFGKTKSYKDITTVLVGDEEQVERQGNFHQDGKESDEKVEHKHADEDEYDEDECWQDDDEPVVSFTISLSRQSSREDKVKEEEEENESVEEQEEEQEEEGEDIDFWSKIVGCPSKDNDKGKETTVVDDYWGSFTTKSVEENNTAEENEKQEEQFKPIDDFWGVVAQTEEVEEKPVLFVEDEEETPKPIIVSIGKSPSFLKIGTSWDTEFNFWDKSIPTLENRRFSGNFEISEDYESDSGMKSDSGQRHRERHRVKKYKRHSVPVGLPVLRGRSRTSRSLKSDRPREQPFSFVREEDKSSQKSPEHTIVTPVESEISDIISTEDNEPEPTDDNNPNDLSHGWSFWDSVVDRNTTANDAEDFSPDVDIQINLPLPMDNEGQEANKEDELVLEEKMVVTTEESSEDSSKSSGTTVKGAMRHEKQDNSHEGNSDESFKSTVAAVEEEGEEDELPLPEEEILDDIEFQPEIMEKEDKQDELISNVVGSEKSLEIQKLAESIKLSPQEEDPEKHGHGTSCTCHIDSQLSRAESLLWRIERFLHESLSLGSEDDSGVMTDLSRPISDVDTDPDDSPQNSSDLLLSTGTSASVTSTITTAITTNTANTAVVTRRQAISSSRSLREQAASNRANPNNAPLRRPRPQSLIMLESSSSNAEFQEASTTVTKPRSRSAERKRYQRAKTHSRLFQLLQDESSCRDDDEDDDEFFDCEQLLPKTPLSFLHHEEKAKPSLPEQGESIINPPPPITQLHVDTTSRRSRLLPLPLKGILLNSSTETATTSTSSPSGSSGVLSPTSPQTRDRLLADIINEFHLRQKSDYTTTNTTASGRRVSFSQSGSKRFSKFPSKIFKLLQEEFGEEFYQTFELGEIGQQLSPGDLLAQSHFSLMSTTCQQHESSSMCSSIVKSDSGKSTTSDFLEVPPPAPLRRRDFRCPKSPFNKN